MSGVFIAWSWDRVKSLDEGNGMSCVNCYLAFFPSLFLSMSWDADDIYGPRLASQQGKDHQTIILLVRTKMPPKTVKGSRSKLKRNPFSLGNYNSFRDRMVYFFPNQILISVKKRY